MEKISVVVPCYNEEKSLPFFYDEMKKVMKKMSNSEFEQIGRASVGKECLE